jgi:hypothetical protein
MNALRDWAKVSPRAQVQWVLVRLAVGIIPIGLDLALVSYLHFTQLEAFASAALLFLVTFLLLRTQRPSERSEPL